ncbi:MAG: hypothetical protein M3Y58_08210, partial [Chloroflexota bacterium]|nr:hypothetical protein [Chloroflexota bacterium]
ILLPDRTDDEPALPRFAATINDVIAARRAGRVWKHNEDAALPSPTNEMTQVKLDAENLTVTANADTPLVGLAAILRARGFTCAVSERPVSGDTRTVGAAVSGDDNRAAVRDALLAVETTLHDGHRARFGSNAVKDVAGYDMKRLWIGSGTAFGTLNRVTLRLLPARS